MVTVDLNAQAILGIVGVFLSLLFSYFPRLNTWYAGLTTEGRSGVMIGLLALSSVVIVLLGCTGLVLVVSLVCTQAGIVNAGFNLVLGFVSAMTANQGTYLATHKLQTKKAISAKLAGDIKRESLWFQMPFGLGCSQIRHGLISL
jgi:hypothetical protein